MHFIPGAEALGILCVACFVKWWDASRIMTYFDFVWYVLDGCRPTREIRNEKFPDFSRLSRVPAQCIRSDHFFHRFFTCVCFLCAHSSFVESASAACAHGACVVLGVRLYTRDVWKNSPSLLVMKNSLFVTKNSLLVTKNGACANTS